MDASAYLRRQGWRGDGHSLDHTNRGIKKPLLVSKKVDVLGLGNDKHATLSDQWWLRAFDQGLKKLGTGEESVLASVQKHGIKRGGLYSRFVQGEQIAGSIGQSPVLNSPAEPMSRAESPPQETAVATAPDIPPQDKPPLRVVNGSSNQHSQNAMLHLLQNPHDAPASMIPVLDKKRKRAETASEKRARRKTERTAESQPKRREGNGVEMEGHDKSVAKNDEERRMERIDARANAMVLEAQRRGFIPLGPNEIRKGIKPVANDANAVPVRGQGPDDLQQIIDKIGWNTQGQPKATDKLKADKYARERMKRQLKRAAKAYILCEVSPESTKKSKKAKTPEQILKTAQKEADAARKQANLLATREERRLKKAAQRANKRAETAKVLEAAKERDAALSGGKEGAAGGSGGDQNAVPATNTDEIDEFETGADEVRLGVNGKQARKKRIPGIGAVKRYPTKAEKRVVEVAAIALREGVSELEIQARIDDEQRKEEEIERAKIDNYRVMKRGMTLDQYRDALAKGEVVISAVEKQHLPPEKLAEYQKRAAKKGVTVEGYIRRREEKSATKVAEKIGNPLAQANANVEESNDVAFVVDTRGDDNFENGNTEIDDIGIYYRNPDMKVPLDQRIWEGKVVKELPKHIRRARRDWMAAKREAKKARGLANGALSAAAKKKSRGERKVEVREAFVEAILVHSREAGGQGLGTATIDGVEAVPLVKIETITGAFNKGETSLARTVARRVLRNEKRVKRETKGKGKGYKKKERAAQRGEVVLKG